MKKAAVVVGLLMVWVVVNPGLWSQDKDRAELAKAVTRRKCLSNKACSASAHEGKPISAKFEIEDGKLQLSVYTAKGDTFSEVVVDHKRETPRRPNPSRVRRPFSGKNTKRGDGQGKAVAECGSRESPEGQPGIFVP